MRKLIVIFSTATGKSIINQFPEDTDFDHIVVSPISEFKDVESASDKILEYDKISFLFDGMMVDFKVLENLFDLVKPINGVVYGDYVHDLRGMKIPRLRSSFKKNSKKLKNRIVPIFGSVITKDVSPLFLSELINLNGLNLDSFIEYVDTKHIPYHHPEFVFTV